MDKDFIQYVYVRINKALEDNKQYMELQLREESQEEIQAKAEELCYMQGFNDAIALILNSNS